MFIVIFFDVLVSLSLLSSSAGYVHAFVILSLLCLLVQLLHLFILLDTKGSPYETTQQQTTVSVTILVQCMCSMRSGNLCNLQIVLHNLGIVACSADHATVNTQSAECATVATCSADTVQLVAKSRDQANSGYVICGLCNSGYVICRSRNSGNTICRSNGYSAKDCSDLAYFCSDLTTRFADPGIL